MNENYYRYLQLVGMMQKSEAVTLTDFLISLHDHNCNDVLSWALEHYEFVDLAWGDTRW